MKENAREVFARNLQNQLDKAGKTQADLVRDLGYKQPTVSDWSKGKKYPRVDKMQELADYFGVLMSDLTEEKPAPRGSELSPDRQEFYEKVIQLNDSQFRMVYNIVDEVLRERDK